MKGKLIVKDILHPTCFATCNGAVAVLPEFQAGLTLFDYFIDGQKSLTAGLFQDLCPRRYTIVVKSTFDGCSDTISVSMIAADSTHTTIKKAICKGDAYAFSNQILTKSGTYQAVFPKQNTCDSVAVLHLNVLKSDTFLVEKTICTGTPSSTSMIFKKSNGCDSVIVFSTKIAKNPNIKIIEENKVLSLKSSWMVATYQWFFEGKPIAGAMGSSVTAVADGVYYLEVTDQNACKFNSNQITIFKIGTSDALREDIRIAPNPVQDQLTISADYNIEKVEIINTMGQILLSQNVDNHIITLNTSEFTRGVYFAKIYWNTKESRIFRLCCN